MVTTAGESTRSIIQPDFICLTDQIGNQGIQIAVGVHVAQRDGGRIRNGEGLARVGKVAVPACGRHPETPNRGRDGTLAAQVQRAGGGADLDQFARFEGLWRRQVDRTAVHAVGLSQQPGLGRVHGEGSRRDRGRVDGFIVADGHGRRGRGGVSVGDGGQGRVTGDQVRAARRPQWR